MVRLINENIVNISTNKNALLVEIDKKISGSLLSKLNDDFHHKHYPVSIDRTEIGFLLDGIDARLRHAHELKLEFFDTLEHDLICGVSPITTRFGARCSFTLPGTVINREFSITDRTGYLDVVHTAFQDFILTIASLLENLVRLTETLVRKVIVNSPKRKAQAGTETLQLYIEFLEILTKLNYRVKDDVHTCFTSFDPFFEKYLVPLYKLRGSFIHGYRENLVIDPITTGACLVRRIDDSFNQLSNADLILNQFADQIFDNLEKLTIDLLDCLAKKIGDPTAHIPI